MKKIFKIAATALTACLAAICMAITVSAETEDVELSVDRAVPTSGAWGQSVYYDKSQFDCARITPDTIIYIEYTTEGELVNTAGYAAEMIFQNYTTADPQIWAKVAPFEFTETSASYKYDDIVKAYGSEDLSTVDNMCIGDCGVILTATKITLTNCKPAEEVTTTTVAETTEAVTEAATEAVTTAETTAATTAAPAEKESDGEIPIILIVIISVVVAVAVVVTVIVIKSKRRFY